MVDISFSEPTFEEWRSWRERCKQERENIIDAKESGDDIEIKKSIYDEMKEEVYMSENGPFSGKCAYCETKIIHNQPGDIDHFRPKKAVTDRDGNPIRVEIDGQTVDHPGYYWLAYDWENLLPTCIICNRGFTERFDLQKIGKGNKFPIRNEENRATLPGEEDEEYPLLINPVKDDPCNHIGMDSENGVFYHKSQKGKLTIRVFGLNDRGLPDSRIDVYTDTRNKIGDLFSAILSDDKPQERILEEIENIKDIKDGNNEFTIASLIAIKDAYRDIGILKKIF